MRIDETLDILAKEAQACETRYTPGGMPHSVIKEKTEQTIAIVKAYETLAQARGLLFSIKCGLDEAFPDLSPVPIQKFRHQLDEIFKQ